MSKKVSPMVLARDLRVRPQVIYQAIRKGRIKSWTVDGKVVVDEQEAKSIISTPGKRGRPAKEGGKSSGYAATPKVSRGDLVSWGTLNGRRLAHVDQAGRLIVTGRDSMGIPIVFATTRFNQLVLEGKITIEDPIELLHRVRDRFEARQQRKYVEAMDVLLETIRSHDDPGTTPPPEPDDSDLWTEDTGG